VAGEAKAGPVLLNSVSFCCSSPKTIERVLNALWTWLGPMLPEWQPRLHVVEQAFH
jgi:hypothetical protein